MKLVQIICHPENSEKSFTIRAAAAFRNGAEKSGWDISSYHIFYERPTIDFLQHEIRSTNHLSFSWPCWWEMPPYPLVELLQSVFVKGYAFDFLENGVRQVLLNVPVTSFISMGQQKVFNTTNLSEAMEYCGLRPRKFHIFENIGPRLPKNIEELYLEQAYNVGLNLKGK